MEWIKRGSETKIVDVFLRNIGAKSLNEINGWFQKHMNRGYTIKGLSDAVKLALSYKDKKVVIFGDYDVDGIVSTSILYLAFIMAGFKNVVYRIPHRINEGFGVKSGIIEEMSDVDLIVTCDNGVAQIDAIKRAKELKKTVIIIDHHEPVVVDEKVILPPADIIIDGNAIKGQAEFPGLCGAGYSYRFAQELLNYNRNFTLHLLPLAAIGTIADVMELREENYVIVRNGLKYITDKRIITSGLYTLMCELNLTKHCDAHDIGFLLGPVINAYSRMGGRAEDIVDLLVYNGAVTNDLIVKVKDLVRINNERKQSKYDGLKAVNQIISDEILFGDCPMVVYVPNIKEGITGILAGNLVEQYKVPVIVLTDAECGLKGSGRSCGNYNMKAELDKVASLMITYGGHEGAAGLSLQKEKLDEFRTALNENVSGYVNEESSDVIYYDLEMDAKDAPDVISELEKYEPFGNGNAPIVFKVNRFSVIPQTGKFVHHNPTNTVVVTKMYSTSLTAVGFDVVHKFSGNNDPKSVNLVGVLSSRYFNGKVTNQIEFKDFVQNELVKIQTPLANSLKSMAIKKAY